MPGPKEQPRPSPEGGEKQSSPRDNGESFQRAESLLAAGNADSDSRAREAFASIEQRKAGDRPSDLTEDADILNQSLAEQGIDDDVDTALDEKVRAEGVEAADDTSRAAWDLTPHNI